MSDCINRGCSGKKDGVCLNDFPGVKCYGYEPPRKTNGDRIRGMTDEELAEWIKRLIINASRERCGTRGVWTKAEIAGGEIIPWIDWLKQEDKGND